MLKKSFFKRSLKNQCCSRKWRGFGVRPHGVESTFFPLAARDPDMSLNCPELQIGSYCFPAAAWSCSFCRAGAQWSSGGNRSGPAPPGRLQLRLGSSQCHRALGYPSSPAVPLPAPTAATASLQPLGQVGC